MEALLNCKVLSLDLFIKFTLVCVIATEFYKKCYICFKQHRGFNDHHSQKIDSRNVLQSVDTGDEDNHIEWSNLIFLPFHPVFQMLVLFSVIIKTTLGPLQSVYHMIYCWEVMDNNFILSCFKYFYWYAADTIYGIDTLLHIIHRQVTDKAMRREYEPKSAFLLLLDIISLIPFFRLTTADIWQSAQLWPNLMAFNEFLIFYRIWQYFNLISTHSYFKLVLGFTVMFAITINCLATFWVLLTYEGLCANCKQSMWDYDWRANLKYKLNQSDVEQSIYIYAVAFVSTHGLREVIDHSLPSTILEFIMTCLFILAGYMVVNIIVVPKAFAESILRLLRVFTKYPAVRKIIEETKRRNPSRKAYQHVETYYTIMWTRRSGIVHMPDLMGEIPRYLRLEVKQDLLWPLFYHSPTLRKTSNALKRWLSDCVQMGYKLPGEKFYEGSQCLSNLYYLNSGVVQVVSSDDGTTPVLSVTSGTIFGDVNFLLPHRKRKVALRCLTYCEVYILSRGDLLRALYRFPEDRENILGSFQDRINHAKKLFDRKSQIRGLDRNADEGIAWINKRWWEIFEAVSAWKKKAVEKESQPAAMCELPREEFPYHCAKYLGQLVLCTDPQLQTKSMFLNEQFPWILSPYSTFGTIWRKIVVVTVFIALCTYPPNIVLENVPIWFQFVKFWTDMVYTVDLCVSLLTALRIRENESPTLASVMFERCKTFNFILDILSTIRLEQVMMAIGHRSLYNTIQSNRLIKIYVLFSSDYVKWDIRRNPMIDVCIKIIIIHFSNLIIISYLIYEICDHYPRHLTIEYFFGVKLCTTNDNINCLPVGSLFSLVVPRTYASIIPEDLPLKQNDIYLAIISGFITYIIYAYCKGRFLAFLYLKNRHATNYEYFVMNLKKYYQHYRINEDLLKRLEKYLVCHYKYYKGWDVMHPTLLKHEPFEIFWKVKGEVAEKIIGDSKIFKYADPALIRELACASKYVILPKNASLYLFGYQSRYVTWVVQGFMKSECHAENGELVRKYYAPGDMLSISSIIFAKDALKTYTTSTECEILYIRVQEFMDIFKRYPLEWQYLNATKQEFKSEIELQFWKQFAYHKQYLASLREKLLANSTQKSFQDTRSSPIEGKFWSEPESSFMQTWLMFRAITVFVSIANASLRGGIGALASWPFQMVGAFCDCIAWIDITLKLFIAYYDDRGLLITAKKKCFWNYITKGFALDVIGALPWFEVFRALLWEKINSSDALLINTCCKFAHIYIVFAYFNYISDLPTVKSSLIMIVKWQVINILIVLGVSHYLTSNCVDLMFDDYLLLNEVHLRNDCWIPDIFNLSKKLDTKALQFIFIQSLHLAECGMMRMNHGGFIIDRKNYALFMVLFLLGLLFWFVTCYTLALLVLTSRENTLFQHGVNNLKTFLLNERVDGKIIDKAVAHFRYCWMRTKGINTEQMKNERIGVVFRQDLTYFFFKQTFAVLDTLLMGGEGLQRQLSSVSSVHYFLPGHEIMREMDLMENLFVVHRGKVILKKNGRKVITLTKGDIFGQLIGSRLRPVNISAEADNNVDLLQVSVKFFQEIITDQVRNNIAINRQSKYDFLATKSYFEENPYDTVEYILRGKKAVQLPWMSEPKEASCRSWYARWLQLSWFCGPCITAFIVMILPWKALPPWHVQVLYIILIVFDVIHFANFVTEFYSARYIVMHNKLVKSITGFGVFRQWGFYVDGLSLLIPLITLGDDNRYYQLARLLRLKWFINFEYQLCQGFKSKTAPRVLKTSVFLLLLHAFTCGWIFVACSDEEFPFYVPDFKELNASIDYGEWLHPKDRIGGCARATRNLIKSGNKTLPAFVVPRYWAHDYIVALTFMILIHTHTSLDTVMAITLNQVYYKIVVTFALYILDLWLMAIAISAVYTKLRDLYTYDYHARNLRIFLKDSGLCPTLSKLLRKYTKQLWKKHKGVWLPQLAYQAPICLREDLFVALYMHHLDAPSTFRHLPYHFKRQLAARFERTVIFPGKCIVYEGDVLNVTYFIHEGEVEKWYNDISGEGKMVSLLYTNGYFGCIPGLFVDSAFQFSYYTRTVVDLVYLRLQNWKDLLDGYPDIKTTIFESTRAMKLEAQKTAQ